MKKQNILIIGLILLAVISFGIFILVSGIFFGYMHVAGSTSLTQWLYIIPYSSLGISFAIMYNKTNTVFTSITIHSIHNTILTILSILV